jgi:hypothetical protein
MSQYDLKVEYYSDKCIVVRGEDTSKVKDHLLSMGGKYNSRLRGGPGWIFPKTKEMVVRDLTDDGKIPQAKDYRKSGSSTYQAVSGVSAADITRLHAKVDKLQESLKKLSRKHEALLKKILASLDPEDDNIVIIESSEDESSEEEEVAPMPRLLGPSKPAKSTKSTKKSRRKN